MGGYEFSFVGWDTPARIQVTGFVPYSSQLYKVMKAGRWLRYYIAFIEIAGTAVKSCAFHIRGYDLMPQKGG